MSLFIREMPCQELVELVTAYFDGSLSRRTGAASTPTSAAASTAPRMSSRCAS